MKEYFKDLLKPCPYCGGEPVWYGHYEIICEDCGLGKADSPQATRVQSNTTLGAAITWNNLRTHPRKRIPLVCPVCGSCEIECYMHEIKKYKISYICGCKKCEIYGPPINGTPFDSLELFNGIDAPGYRAALDECTVAVTVVSGHRAEVFDSYKKHTWEIDALEQAAKSYFWKGISFDNVVHIYGRYRPNGILIHRLFKKWPMWARKILKATEEAAQ